MSFNESNNAGIGFIENFEARYPLEILKQLLKDRTTGNNVIWADDEYEELGEGYQAEDEITIDKIIGVNSGVIKPRIAKEQEKQSQRTKSHAEVFTPFWLCNKMNNDIDEIWFKKRNVFNNEVDKNWEPTTSRIVFPKIKGHGWHAYVESPRLEITCGEAPYVCSRYDTVTGHQLNINKRIGILDRKLRVVTERTNSVESWRKWAFVALKSCFGYEYQGDNLVIARVNVFETVEEDVVSSAICLDS